MNHYPMAPSMYRPNYHLQQQQQQHQQPQQHQPYIEMPQVNERTSRPRFGFQGPFPYPRPRSSASKPNPGHSYSQNNDPYINQDGYYMTNQEVTYNSNAHSSPDVVYRGNVAVARNYSYMSDASDSSYTTCLDASFSARFNSSLDLSSPYKYQNEYSSSNQKGNYRNYDTPSAPSSSTPKPYKKQYSMASQQNGQNQSYMKNLSANNPTSAPKGVKRKAMPSDQPPKMCEVCNIEFTSQVPLDMHLRGSRHMKKLKSLETLKDLQARGHTDVTDSKCMYRCDPCDVFLNSAIQLNNHCEGTKHKNKLKEMQGQTNYIMQYNRGSQSVISMVPSNVAPVEQSKPAKYGKFECETCNLLVNSQVQLLQHMASNKHKAKVDGKPIVKKKTLIQVTEANGGKADDSMEMGSSSGPIATVVGVPPLSSNFVHKETMN